MISEYSEAGKVSYQETGCIGAGDPSTTIPKVVRWPLDPSRKHPSSLTATGAATVKQKKIQGVVSRKSKGYLSVSDGPSGARTSASTVRTPPAGSTASM